MTNNMELKFKASLINESLARTAVVAFIESTKLGMDTISEVKTIISEAVSNAIIHGYRLDATKDVIIKCSLVENELEICVLDFGRGIPDVELAKTPHYTTRPDLERAGMGLTIIEALSDSFTIRSVLNMGTKLMIKKVLPVFDSEEILDGNLQD